MCAVWLWWYIQHLNPEAKCFSWDEFCINSGREKGCNWTFSVFPCCALRIVNQTFETIKMLFDSIGISQYFHFAIVFPTSLSLTLSLNQIFRDLTFSKWDSVSNLPFIASMFILNTYDFSFQQLKSSSWVFLFSECVFLHTNLHKFPRNGFN